LAHMQTPDEIEFWFTMGSTYTYLSVMRLDEVEKKTGVRFRWRPFDLNPILRELKHTPFKDQPIKMAYIWRDIERRAAMYGIPARLPAPYPSKDSARANRIAMLAIEEGWGREYVRASYERWFRHGEPNGEDANVVAALRVVGQDLDRVLHLAYTEDRNKLFDAETSTARSLGIFGSPTFVVGAELFWGDDRLQDALSWYREGRVA
jgi:2-hydroxychromene-2-carboxylate isomerase